MLGRTLALVVTAIVFAFVGTQVPRGKPVGKHAEPQQCHPNCNVEVRVEKWGSDCVVNCLTYVDYDVTVVAKGTTIQWEIKDDHEFSGTNGIVFSQTSGVACTQVDKKKIKCDSGSNEGVQKYTVNLTGKDPLDPWVVNN
jgi:hypothetical protein